MAKQKKLVDKRLLGTWISDREKTFENWKPSRDIRPAQVKKFKDMFGKLAVRYTPSFIHSGFLGDRQSKDRYFVVAKDAHSVVIQLCYDQDDLTELISGSLRQIHFLNDDEYYITVFYGFSECFRRVK